MMAFSTSTFAGIRSSAIQRRRRRRCGPGTNESHTAGVLFAIAPIDASVIGAVAVAVAVGLSTSYAVSDVLGLKQAGSSACHNVSWCRESPRTCQRVAWGRI